MKILRLPEVFDRQVGRIPVGPTKFYEDFVHTGRVKLIPLGPQAVGVSDANIDQVVAQLITEGQCSELLIKRDIDLADRDAVAQALAGMGYADQPDQQPYFIDRTIAAARHKRQRAAKVAGLTEATAAKRANKAKRRKRA